MIEEGNAMLSNLQILNLQPQVCLRDRDSAYKPINLYHKVGHGKLDMYVINPSKEAKEIREFMERWNGENSKTLGKYSDLPNNCAANLIIFRGKNTYTTLLGPTRLLISEIFH